MAVSDDEVIAELTGDGTRVEDHFLLGHEICIVNRKGVLMSLLVEDLPGELEGEMHLAILDFLRRRGARFYEAHEEYHRQTRS